tara:strand:+ start:1563 stop:1892 length:330 start_codon:yes stop_codon:yes gene_type:complete
MSLNGQNTDFAQKIKNLFTISYLRNVFIRNFYEVFFIALFITFLQRPPKAHTRAPTKEELAGFSNKFVSVLLIYLIMDTFAPVFVDSMRVGISLCVGTQLAGGILMKTK